MRSGLITGLAAAALALSLGGCDEIRKMTGMEAPAENGSTAGNTATASGSPSLSAPAAPGAAPPKPTAASNPALEAEMTAAAAQLSGSLPIQVDQITRVVAIRAEGTEFVYDLQVSQAFPAAQAQQIRETLQRTNQSNICRNPAVATFIARGGSMNHRYTDSAGNRYETRVVSCP